MRRAVQLRNSLHADHARALAFDPRPHFAEQMRQIHHLRLARRVLQHGFPIGENRGHQNIFRARNRNAIEDHMRALQSIRRDRFDIAVLLRDSRTQMFQSRQMEIDGPRADRTPARQRNPRASRPRHQRPQHEARCPHRLHQFVGSFRRYDRFCIEHHSLGVALVNRDFRTDVDQQALHRADIAHARNAFEHHLFIGEQRRGKGRQSGILRPVGRDRTVERHAALNHKLIHYWLFLCAFSQLSIAARTLFPASVSIRPASSYETPVTSEMMRFDRSSSLEFFGWTFTIRFPRT